MAGRNRNTFLKRQKEMERTRKAREKMARRHGKKGREAEPGEGEPAAGTGEEGPGELAPAEPQVLVAAGEEEQRVQRAE